MTTTTTTFTMEQAIRASVTSAFKAIEFKKYHVDDDKVLDAMLEDVFALMFPKTGAQEVVVPVTVSVPEPEAKKKKTASKPKKDKAVEELADGVAAMKVEEAPVKEKKKAAPKEKKAETEEKKVGEKRKEPGPPTNIDKFNPTQTKKIKQISEELKAEIDKKALLMYMNNMTADEFDAKKIEDHIRSFVAPKVVEQVAKVDLDSEVECDEVEFNGKTYYVQPVTRRVYEQQGEVNVAVGYVGMAEFANMPY